jgi:hypothetical protein
MNFSGRAAPASLPNKKLRFDKNYGVNVSVNKVEVLLFYLNVAKVHFLVVLATNAINKSCRGHHFVQCDRSTLI